MAYCGECQHWTHKKEEDGLKMNDIGICDVSGAEAGHMRHSCLMFEKRRKLEDATKSPIERAKQG